MRRLVSRFSFSFTLTGEKPAAPYWPYRQPLVANCIDKNATDIQDYSSLIIIRNRNDQDTSSYSLIEFDSENNLIRKTKYYRNSPSDEYEMGRDFVFEYDSKNQIFRDINYPRYASFKSQINNIIKETISYGPYFTNPGSPDITNYSYIYNDNNFPVVCLKNSNDTILWITYE